jgi:uncharacterized protein YbbK (DUF523 family)
MILVSACLTGLSCKYNGSHNGVPIIQKLVKTGKAIPLCPEQLGGLSTPRIPAEIKDGNGSQVLRGEATVVSENGTDVTANFIRGAMEVLNFCKAMDINYAILKSRSPSCGKGKIYDGAFTGKMIDGNGVTAQILMDHGIVVMTEQEFIELCKHRKNC